MLVIAAIEGLWSASQLTQISMLLPILIYLVWLRKCPITVKTYTAGFALSYVEKVILLYALLVGASDFFPFL